MHATTTPLNTADRATRAERCASVAYHAQQRGASSVAAVGSSWNACASRARSRGLRSGSKLRCESM